jgi:hypothetical protein
VKSIFLVIGARGGAAKLNHTVRSSITQDEVLPWPFSVAWLPAAVAVLVPGVAVPVPTGTVPGSVLPSPVAVPIPVLSAVAFVAADEVALFSAWLEPGILVCINLASSGYYKRSNLLPDFVNIHITLPNLAETNSKSNKEQDLTSIYQSHKLYN